uniref:Phosphohydrolase n=1 Tax=Caldimicrobium thiodismutans TaxID=1653476 RepID=A0A832LU56_9BACT
MRCPGQDWRYWKEDAIFEVNCPHCGESIEFFKDDTVRKCPHCKRTVPNPRMDFGCAAYCKYAELCLGELPPELIREKANLLKERLLSHLEKVLPANFYYSLRNTFKELEDTLKEKGQSPGTKLFLLIFYYLTPEQREELYKMARLPEVLWDEIRIKLKNLPTDLDLESLKGELLKEGE